jgi:heat shock protein HtpX
MVNNIKTVILLGILTVFLIFIGRIIGGQNGLYLAMVIALLVDGGSYFFSDKIALSVSGAKPLTRSQAPQIYTIVRNLSDKFGIPMPKLYITPELQANAFATGRNPNHASIAITAGLLHLLPLEEIRAVLSHEMSHIKNRDVLITSITAVLAGAIAFLGNLSWYGGFNSSQEDRKSENGIVSFLLILLTPLAATLIQLAISREREYEADETGAKAIGSGEPLALALSDINNSTRKRPMVGINPAFSSLYISNPLGNTNGIFLNLFSTHPPLKERISRLKGMKFSE